METEVQVQQALSVVSDNRSTLPQYTHGMATLGRSLVDRASKNADVGDRMFHVVACVEDFDALAVPVIRQLESAGHEVAFSCVWLVERRFAEGPRGTVVSVAMSADERPFDGENTRLGGNPPRK